MANERLVEEILVGVGPTKNGAQYNTAGVGFMEFLGKGEGEKASIGEEDFICYMAWAREEKGWASSTLWTMFPRLNNCFKRKIGDRC